QAAPAHPTGQTTRKEPVFHGSAQTTVGVEVELPILDRESGDLVPGAPRVLQACAEESIDGVGAELMQSMLEVRTQPCATVGEIRDGLYSRLRRVRNIVTSLGYDLALLGTHPFLRPSTNAVYPSERFENAAARLAWMVYYRVAFGLHIHVGVQSGDQA